MMRATCLLLILSVVMHTTGCAAIFEGQSQSIALRTQPPGGSVYYRGQRYQDGDTIVVQKDTDPPRVNIGTPDRPYYFDLSYDPNPLLILDGLLLFVYVVPGVVALGVDFMTGAWRKLDSTQVVPTGRAD